MNVDDMKRILERHKDELAALDAMTDDDIDFSDIPPITDEQWAHSVRGRFYRPATEDVTRRVIVRLDASVIDWFKKHDDEHQAAMNATLREHIGRHRRAS